MADIPILWHGLNVGAVTPLIVLKRQAAAVSAQTGGLLTGRVVSSLIERRAVHTLIVLAPAINQSVDAVKVEHDAEQPYPAIIVPFNSENSASNKVLLEASPEDQTRYDREMVEFRKDQIEQARRFKEMIPGMKNILIPGLYSMPEPPSPPKKRHKLGSPVPGYEEFVETLSRALQTPSLVGALNSLISKTNEASYTTPESHVSEDIWNTDDESNETT